MSLNIFFHYGRFSRVVTAAARNVGLLGRRSFFRSIFSPPSNQKLPPPVNHLQFPARIPDGPSPIVPLSPRPPSPTLAFHHRCQSRRISHGWMEVCDRGSVEVKVRPRWSGSMDMKGCGDEGAGPAVLNGRQANLLPPHHRDTSARVLESE